MNNNTYEMVENTDEIQTFASDYAERLNIIKINYQKDIENKIKKDRNKTQIIDSLMDQKSSEYFIININSTNNGNNSMQLPYPYDLYQTCEIISEIMKKIQEEFSPELIIDYKLMAQKDTFCNRYFPNNRFLPYFSSMSEKTLSKYTKPYYLSINIACNNKVKIISYNTNNII